jgi:glucose/arabinose dehydrogenase
VVVLLAHSRLTRRAARNAFSVGSLVVLLTSLLAVAPASAAGGQRGEVLGPATRSTAPTSPSAVAAVPTGFSDTAVWSGLTLPTAIAFAPGGKVFVGEKGGIVKVFDSPSDPSPTQVVDLHPAVQDFWDRGLLGLAVDPAFGTTGHNFIYALYTPMTATPSATRPPGAMGVPPRPVRRPTAVLSQATSRASRLIPRPVWPSGRSSR